MKVKRVLTTAVINIFFVLCVPSSAFAGAWIIETPSGSDVSLDIFLSDGSSHSFGVLGTTGITIFTVLDQSNVDNWALEIVLPDGRRFISEVHLSIANSLPFLEPFEIPDFSVADPNLILTSITDLNAFLTEGNQFTVGQTFSVVNGVSSLTNAIVFTDQFGNPFSGTVKVEPFYRVEPVPEPTTMLLLGTGLAGVAIKTRKKLKRRKSGQGKQ